MQYGSTCPQMKPCKISTANVRPRSHVQVFDRPGESAITTAVVTDRSNEQERWDQAVAHSEWSAMDSNSIIDLFLLYRRRKRRRDRSHCVQPIIQKREKFGSFYTLFDELRDEADKFLNYFQMSVSSFDELHRRLKDILQLYNSKMRKNFQPAEIFAVAFR